MKKKKEAFIEKGIHKLKSIGLKNFKANFGDLEEPKSYRQISKDNDISPDITATNYGRKSYAEIGLKNKDNERKLVTKWKFLSKLAAAKRGKFYILAPRGHKMFVKNLVDTYNLNAQILKI